MSNRDSKINFREYSLLVSQEVRFYLKMERKLMGAKIGDGNVLTDDQIADGMLRNRLTTDHPKWVSLWRDMCDAKEESLKVYKDIEQQAIEEP